MKRLAFVLLIVMIATLVVGPSAFAGGGNGAPSGEHYNLNIIGVDNPKNADMTDSQRHTIFVPLSGQCNIQLKFGDFQVLDGNCFKGGDTIDNTFLGAAFQLPKPDPDLDGTLDYTVWARVPGNRGDASAKMMTCYYDAGLNETYCSTGTQITLNRASYSKFVNVSKSLLTVCVNTGTVLSPNFQTKPLFWDGGDTYWWQYDNNGLRLAQLRFYPNVTEEYDLDGTCVATAK